MERNINKLILKKKHNKNNINVNILYKYLVANAKNRFTYLRKRDMMQK